MRAAWASLVASDPSLRASDIRIVPSHLYIRFKPQNEDELDILYQDPTLTLYPYPLDYEIAQGGSYYHDPEVAEDQPTYQYCSVPVGKVLPSGVEYEVLAEAFIPEEIDIRSRMVPNARVGGDELADALVYESNRMTGNLDTSTEGPGPRTVRDIQTKLPSRWTPYGWIRSWDDNTGNSGVVERRLNPNYEGNCDPNNSEFDEFICLIILDGQIDATTQQYTYDSVTGSTQPLEGVQVKARRFLTTHKGWTSSSGYYRCDGTFRYQANYSIKWETDAFTILAGTLWGARLDGPRRRGSWSVSISRANLQQFYADIYRGAYHYNHKEIGGLARPATGRAASFTKTKFAAHNASGRANHSGGFLIFNSRVDMYRREGGNRVYSKRTACITLHELAHAVHRRVNGSSYNNDDYVTESWAVGAAWALIRYIYPEGARCSYPDPFGGGPNGPEYTPVAIDLMDSMKGSDDMIEGFTILQIQDALFRSRDTWNSWRDHLKVFVIPLSNYRPIPGSSTSPPNISVKNSRIDALFQHWGRR